MITEENLPMFSADELPQTDEPKKRKLKVNCLQDIFLELMNDRKVQLVDVQKATGIPWGTIHGWACGDVEVQKLDRNVLELAKYFNVSINYLAFGVGDETPFSNDFDEPVNE